MFVSVINVFSQELSTAGQSYLKFYKQAITKLEKMKPGSMGYENEIINAERKIKDLKKTDPQYNTSQMEAEISSFKKRTNEAEQANEKSFEVKEKFGIKWEDMMYKHTENYYTNSEEDFKNIEAKEKDFETSFSGFLTNEIPKGSQQEEIALEKLRQKFHLGPIDYSDNNGFLNKGEDEKGAVLAFYTSKKLAYGWKVLSDRFPENEDLKATAASAKNKFEELGSIDKLKSTAKANKAKRIAETRMEPAVVKDPELEAQIKKAILNSKFGSGKQVVKVNILSSSWGIQRHAISGIILSRAKSFSAVIKENDGKCTLLHYVDFSQDYVGSTYGQGYIHLGQTTEILCENINK